MKTLPTRSLRYRPLPPSCGWPPAHERTVSGLTPYIAHGFVARAEVLASVAVRPALDVPHKFFVELGGRACFRHGSLRRASCSEDLAVSLLAVNEVPAC